MSFLPPSLTISYHFILLFILCVCAVSPNRVKVYWMAGNFLAPGYLVYFISIEGTMDSCGLGYYKSQIWYSTLEAFCNLVFFGIIILFSPLLYLLWLLPFYLHFNRHTITLVVDIFNNCKLILESRWGKTENYCSLNIFLE